MAEKLSNLFGYSSFSNLISKRFAFRETFAFGDIPDVENAHPLPIVMAYGLPHDGFFPVDKITLGLVDKPFQTYRNNHKTTPINILRKSDDGIDLRTQLQYQDDDGSKQFQQAIRDWTMHTHLPLYDDGTEKGHSKWNSIVSFGTGDAVYKVFDMLLDAGDSCLVEEYTFVPTTSSITCFGASIIPVKMNLKKDGIDVEALEYQLRNWSKLYPDKKFPKCIYTIPTGQNPIGTTQTLETRKFIYNLCEKYNIIIIEDDPYGYLALAPHGTTNPFGDDMSTETFFKKHIAKSYIELDTSGRVIRLESFSKMLLPGLRLGIIVSNAFFIDRIKLFIGVLTKMPSGVSEAFFCKIYSQWGHEGLLRWAINLLHEYTERMHCFVTPLLESSLVAEGKLNVLEPHHGMFVSVQFNFDKRIDVETAMSKLETLGIQMGIIFVLGTKLSLDAESRKHANFVRVAILYIEDEKELKEGASRFEKVAQEYFKREKLELEAQEAEKSYSIDTCTSRNFIKT